MDDVRHPSPPIRADHIPDIIPILPIVDTNLFPKMVLPLVLIQSEAVELIDEAMAGNRMLGLLLSRRSDIDSRHTTDDLYRIGTIAIILKMSKMEESKAQLLIQGLERFRIVKFLRNKKYMQAQIEVVENRSADRSIENRALMANIVEQYEKIVELSPGLPSEMGHMIKSLQEPSVLADMVASTINAPVIEKQKVIELLDVNKRLKKVTRLVNDQLDILEMGSKIQNQVKEDMDKRQREYYLRQQMKAIREELGETGDDSVEIKEYRARIEEAGLPEEARKEAEREMQRLARMHPSSSEYVVASSYLDWLVSLPWTIRSQDKLDIKEARRILNNDHYGLEKPKKRILEYLAVRKLKNDMKGPILCLVGPPGVGKTSLGKSIARALGRKFVRFSLGGVRDEAEIRGHRRTYIGALPGRIIQWIRKAGSNNPIFMLDEVDKIGSDFRGDPASALLEVLDPEQNNTFSDHYLEVDFDLSSVMFITTANILDTIPSALRDRMEVLELAGYIAEEKVKIAQEHLVPKQLAEHGLVSTDIDFNPELLLRIITDYTREAGVRNLEREIATVCRKVAKNKASLMPVRTVQPGGGQKTPGKPAAKPTVQNIDDFLGPIKFFAEIAGRKPDVGVATGMAWTPVGGEILFIETTRMKGNGGLILTGHLGDVMKESARAALSYIRSHSKRLKIPDSAFNGYDIHIHVPAGATPKDGPSAGVAIGVALTSLFINKAIRNDVSMTGEINLRGKIMPVGGIKEKVIGARRAGIKTIILPRENEKDLKDIPKHIQEGLTFKLIDNLEDALKIALIAKSGGK